MLEFGATRVEIGVQIPDDKIYKKINRGHTVKDVIKATKKLKDAGFKVGYHIMPGLPGSSPEKDVKKFRQIFDDEKFRPDQMKIYPCQVVKDSPLEKIQKKINYKPYNTKKTEKFLLEIFKIVPRYCRIMRIMREIPGERMASETIKLDIRKDVENKLRSDGFKVEEIRMREIGFNKKNLNITLNIKVTKYRASEGNEYFLEVINKDDILFGLLRLRIFDEVENSIQSQTNTPKFPSKNLHSPKAHDININDNVEKSAKSDFETMEISERSEPNA